MLSSSVQVVKSGVEDFHYLLVFLLIETWQWIYAIIIEDHLSNQSSQLQLVPNRDWHIGLLTHPCNPYFHSQFDARFVFKYVFNIVGFEPGTSIENASWVLYQCEGFIPSSYETLGKSEPVIFMLLILHNPSTRKTPL